MFSYDREGHSTIKLEEDIKGESLNKFDYLKI